MPPHALAEFELLVMLAALRLGPNEAYTVSIADDIERRTGRSVRRANVHTTLQRLEEKGLISTRLGEPRPERGGRPRRLVTLKALWAWSQTSLCAARRSRAGVRLGVRPQAPAASARKVSSPIRRMLGRDLSPPDRCSAGSALRL